MVDAPFGGKQANGIGKPWICSKNTVVLKEICFETIGTNCPCFDKFDLTFPGCGPMDTNEFNLFNNLTMYDLCDQNVGFYL